MTTAQLENIAQDLEKKSAHEVLEWALSEFHPKIALASSFGAEDVVLIDMMSRINSEARIFTLDTGRLHQETYDLMDQVREKYGIEIQVMFPVQEAVEDMVRSRGMNLFYHSIENRKMCCGIRKIEPLKRALSELDAWITGLRRDQTGHRETIAKVHDDPGFGVVKVNPLADWSSDRIWEYIRDNDVPYNNLHDQDFPSIGCAPCTRAVRPGEDPRSGRWWWEHEGSEGKKECGLHVRNYSI